MKYLELLNRVRDCARKSEKAADALSTASNNSNVQEREARKKQYYECEHEYRVLRGQAMSMARESDDPEMMWVLLLRQGCEPGGFASLAFGQTVDGSILWIEAPRRVDRMSWAEIMRNISNLEEEDLRAAVYFYIRMDLSDETMDYSDCF